MMPSRIVRGRRLFQLGFIHQSREMHRSKSVALRGEHFDLTSNDEKRGVLNYKCSVEAIADYIKKGRASRIVVMVGAGISVSAGIPDFRTPGSGLYDNLQKYNLKQPEQIFDIDYFRNDPAPFYDLARSLFPTNFRPTPTHFFIKLLQEKGLLLRCYTQNIDTLERQAGIDPDLLVEAHGGFGSAHCTKCGKGHSQEFVRQRLFELTDGVKNMNGDTIPWCHCADPKCRGDVKPDIVFYGEMLPDRFDELRAKDLSRADLLIVLGTSLKVHPFASTKDLCGPLAPRLLINLERVGHDGDYDQFPFLFGQPDNYRDVELLAPCDTGVLMLCDMLGWRYDLEELIRKPLPDDAAGTIM